MTTSPNRSIRRRTSCLLCPATAARDRRRGAREKGGVMTEVTPPINVSGVPLDSRASRRIKPGEGGLAERLGDRMHRIHPLFVSWIVANVGAVLLATVMVGARLLRHGGAALERGHRRTQTRGCPDGSKISGHRS